MFVKRLWSIGAVFALVSAIALLIWIGVVNVFQTDASPSTNAESIEDAVRENPSPLVQQEAHDFEMSVSSEGNSIHPRESCSDLTSKRLSDDCVTALDAYFLDKRFVWKSFDWVLVPLTYGSIFADPARDRELVFEALGQSECRLEDGEIRRDLREVCHADSLANYANFMYFCSEVPAQVEFTRNTLVESGVKNGIETYTIPGIYQIYEYWDLDFMKESTWAGERMLEGRWIVERVCVQFEMESMELDLARDHAQINVLKTIGRNLGIFPRSHGPSIDSLMQEIGAGDAFSQRDAITILRALAARLGSDWASFLYEAHQEDNRWVEHEAKQLPWKPYLTTMHKIVNYWKTPYEIRGTLYEDYIEAVEIAKTLHINVTESGEKERESVLEFALSAWEQLDNAGLEIDLDRLAQYVCGPNWMGATQNCRHIISDFRTSGRSIEQGFWHRLSQFEARAMELGLFDADQDYKGNYWETEELGILDPSSGPNALLQESERGTIE